jgi:hypothetical protein
MATFRRDGVYLRRLWWWYPWHLTRWWLPKTWKGGDEWCNVPLCFTVPPPRLLPGLLEATAHHAVQ